MSSICVYYFEIIVPWKEYGPTFLTNFSFIIIPPLKKTEASHLNKHEFHQNDLCQVWLQYEEEYEMAYRRTEGQTDIQTTSDRNSWLEILLRWANKFNRRNDIVLFLPAFTYELPFDHLIEFPGRNPYKNMDSVRAEHITIFN